MKILDKTVRASRWMCCNIDQEFRDKKLDEAAQYHENHGTAKIGIGETKTCTPSQELDDRTKIIAVRKYMGGPYTAIVNLAYYFFYGSHRCNLAQDSDLGSGVYAYTDMKTLLTTLDYSKEEDRQTCIGVVSGYLLKSAGKTGKSA